MNRTRSMKRLRSTLHEVANYAKLVFSRWILWLFVLLDFIALLVQFVTPQLGLPPLVYGLLALIGFFWAGFDVHRQTIRSHEKTVATYRNTIDKLSREINIDALLLKPNIAVSLLEGNEYTYSLHDEKRLTQSLAKIQAYSDEVEPDADNKESTYSLPNADLHLHLRIENLGCSVDILAINTEFDRDRGLPFSLGMAKSLTLDGESVKYPVSLQPGTIHHYDLDVRIRPHAFHTEAQFSARLKDSRDQKKYTQNVEIWLEAVDASGTRTKFSIESNVSVRPLIDLYINHWQKAEKHELIRLAGGATQKPKSMKTP